MKQEYTTKQDITGNKIIGVRAEPELLAAAEKAAKKAGTNRADFTRQVLIQTLQKMGFIETNRD